MPALPATPLFMSYSRKDDDVMRTIAFFLRDQGFKVWVDNEKLIPGTPAWEESIEKAISNAFAVIVVLSPDSKSSEWVRREISYADQFKKRVFPVLVRGTEDMSLPIRLITRQYVDFRQGEEAGLSSLLAAIMFYVEERQTMELPRPAKPLVEVEVSKSTPAYPPAKSTKFPNRWTLAAGGLMTLCILGLGVLWLGYRFFSFPVPVTGPTSVEATSILSIATEAPTNTPAVTSPPPTVIATNTSYAVSGDNKASEFLTDIQIVNEDTFDDPSGMGWDLQQIGEVKNGTLEIVGRENMDAVWRTREFREGEGLLIDFRYTERATFIAFLDFGSFNVSSYRRFGLFVENGTPITDIYVGNEYIWGGFSGNLSATPDHTYTLLLAILPGGEMLEVVWDSANPNEPLEYRNKFDETWAGLTWTFIIQSQAGTVQFDNFREIMFSGAK